MHGHLARETSPYLLQHRDNPVEWYPWCDEAFARARDEDKPIFLSIGYSSCHWCHVMAHESFEDEEVADLLNAYFISIKVDKEERPDIDSIYMSVCQAFTGSGGWPTSIFMTPDQKPFYAGTYFPKHSRRGSVGLMELLSLIHEKWETDRSALLQQAEQIVAHIRQPDISGGTTDDRLPETALGLYKRSFDQTHGGFGRAPKFPVPHNLLFLLTYYERRGDPACLEMAERTLTQMYRGGLFDHIGYGFSRYSTDERFLVPHFEKMLYDNALLIPAYCQAYSCTENPLYLEIAEKTADYILREMTAPDGGFFSAQDADSDGEEGKYYGFSPDEICSIIGQSDGDAFNRHYGITPEGNFEGRSIPNLLGSEAMGNCFDHLLPKLREYRKARSSLHLDDKILTAWNGLMIAALCRLYRVSRNVNYLHAAQKADRFIWEKLSDGDTLFASFRDGKRGVRGFLDDYAASIYAQLALYGATLDAAYLTRAEKLCSVVHALFGDPDSGGYYLYDAESESLILRPKERYDGAIPSGNSIMAWNLVHLAQLTGEAHYAQEAARQLDFLAASAAQYPTGHAMYLLALLNHFDPPPKVTIVPQHGADRPVLPARVPPDMLMRLLDAPTAEYPLRNGQSTYYLCRGHSCLPPVNDLNLYL